ncbi:MAG: flagellar protein FlaG [Clostridiales bacterium]|nr:flagellar protein FlaG [Clostridiales bacterium]
MRVEPVNNILHVQTVNNVTNDNIKNTQEIQTQVNKRREDYNYRELSQKSKYELTLDESLWIKMIERANKAIVGTTCRFEYSIHEGTKEIMVKVINQETDEVIREIPPEKILNMVAKMWEIAGIIVDERR